MKVFHRPFHKSYLSHRSSWYPELSGVTCARADLWPPPLHADQRRAIGSLVLSTVFEPRAQDRRSHRREEQGHREQSVLWTRQSTERAFHKTRMEPDGQADRITQTDRRMDKWMVGCMKISLSFLPSSPPFLPLSHPSFQPFKCIYICNIYIIYFYI